MIRKKPTNLDCYIEKKIEKTFGYCKTNEGFRVAKRKSRFESD